MAAETEAKFHVARLPEVRRRLETQGAQLLQERASELNLRFDTPNGRLARQKEALRLRQDAECTLTFKGPGQWKQGIRTRPELVVRVDSFEAARGLLRALGFVPTFTYEKFRTIYGLARTLVMLDELPYGDFVEIEGPLETIRPIAASLDLNWEAAVLDSYAGLFEKLRRARGLHYRDLTFSNFAEQAVSAVDMGIRAADGP